MDVDVIGCGCGCKWRKSRSIGYLKVRSIGTATVPGQGKGQLWELLLDMAGRL
jgi:hypothetical protein